MTEPPAVIQPLIEDLAPERRRYDERALGVLRSEAWYRNEAEYDRADNRARRRAHSNAL